MKLQVILVLIIFLIACNSEARIFSLVPIEYTFSQNELFNGKIFVYVDRSNGERFYTELYSLTRDDKRYLIQRSYSDKGGSDSIIYLNNKMIEAYSYMFTNDHKTRAEILLDKLTQNGTRLGKRTLKVNFHTDSTLLNITTESEFVKDTTFSWNGSLVPTLIIKHTTYSILKSKFNFGAYTNIKIEFLSYEAKGIGTIRTKYLTTFDNKIKFVDLIQIKDKST